MALPTYLAIPIALSTLILSVPVRATTHRVPSEYPTINAGLDAASFGDTVLVAPGTYDVPETRQFDVGGGGIPTVTSLAFLKDGVSLVSEGGSAVTTLDLTGWYTNRWVVAGGLMPSDETLVEGFRILGASGVRGVHLQVNGRVTIRDCSIENCSRVDGAGGIENRYSSLVLEGSSLINCSASVGAALRVRQGDLMMIGCLIESCSTQDEGIVTLGGDSFGSWTGEMIIRSCEFRNNTAQGGGAGVWQSADGYLVRTIENCWFEGNQALGVGGDAAVLMSSLNTPDVTRIVGNTFILNTSHAQGGRAIGGIAAGDIHVENNTFYGNWQADPGELLTLHGGGNRTTHNIMVGNTGGPVVGNHIGFFDCNVVWNNDPPMDLSGLPATNRAVDPMFCDAAGGDFTLMSSSPCLPAHSNGCDLIGPFGAGCGTVSISPETWGTIKARYRGAEPGPR